MTKREVLSGSFALAVGMVVGALLVRRHGEPPRVGPGPAIERVPTDATDAPNGPGPDEALDPDDASVAMDDAVPPLTEDASRTPRASRAGAEVDAAHPAHDAHAQVFREKDLLVRPVGAESLCLDAQHARAAGLQLFSCHGKRNQRWTFAEDPSGATRVLGAGGECLRAGSLSRDGDPLLELAPCGSDSLAFHYDEGRRLRDLHSGQCVTVRALEKHAPVTLSVCSASTSGQSWALSRP